jgi:hypothetical protein
MRREGVDALGAHVPQLVRRGAERAGRVDHVVHDDAVAVLDGADQVHLPDHAGLLALLDDHRHRHVDADAGEPVAEHLGARYAAGVGRYHDQVLQVFVPRCHRRLCGSDACPEKRS